MSAKLPMFAKLIAALVELQAALRAIRPDLIALNRRGWLLRGGFNLTQPRDDFGRWTTGVGGFVPIADKPRAFDFDTIEEDARGGHTHERHVGKSEAYLKARIHGTVA